MKKSKIALWAALVASAVLFSCDQIMKVSTEETKAKVRAQVDEIWNEVQLDKVDEYYATDFVRHLPNSWDPSLIEGSEAFAEYVAGIHETFTGFHVELDKIVVEGDMVASTWTVTGTHNESGNALSANGMTMARYADGKAKEEWVAWDTHEVMEQIGMSGTEEMEE